MCSCLPAYEYSYIIMYLLEMAITMVTKENVLVFNVFGIRVGYGYSILNSINDESIKKKKKLEFNLTIIYILFVHNINVFLGMHH